MAEFFDLANLITTVGVDSVKIKTEPGIPEKSSNDILTELFSTFEQGEGIVSAESDNEPVPEVHVKLENPETLKRKKSKKKHKHKDKKHKKKSKKNLSESETNAEDDGHKKHKKHKKKSKRRHDSCSSKSSDLDDPKHKIKKVANDSILRNNSSDFDSPDANSETTDNMNLEKTRVIQQEPEPNEKLTEQIVQRQLPTSPKLPPMVKESLEDDLGDMVVPRLLETSKQTAQAKILIKDLKNSKVYSKVVKEVEDKARAKAARMEDGELSDSSGNRTPTLSPSPTSSDRVESPGLTARYGSEKARRDDLRLILKEKELKKRLEESNKLKLKNNKDPRDNKFSDESVRRGRSRDRKRSKSKTRSTVCHTRSDGKEKSHERSRDTRDKGRSKDRWERDRSREYRKIGRDIESRYKSRSRERSWERYNHRGRTRSRERKERIEIDKKKLLEIARRNAISMIQKGALPLAQQDKVIAAIQAGGKTVDELTDFCKSLSKSEALGELSSISSDEDGSGSEKGFHHPFLVKDRPNSIIMNIRDAKQLPTRTFQEKTAESCNQLRLQFPVSSGQQHRTTENEWVPVTPKKSEPKKTLVPAITTSSEPLAIMAAPVPPPIAPVQQVPVFTTPIASETVDIGYIVSQRLAAMRKLRENPHDVEALNEMYRAQTEMKTWAESKQMPGQFTGSTGVKVLSAAELSAGNQAWARKDQLVSAQPVSGGMGMALLQKMGWRPGEGLGKNKEGALVPLQLEVKLDKRGLISDEDIGHQRPGKVAKPVIPVIKTLEGKHPVSLLGEYCSKRKFGAPVYELCFECGPDHRKNFLFKVKVNNIEYKPSVASPNKKQAKAEAAQICLQTLGLLPT